MTTAEFDNPRRNEETKMHGNQNVRFSELFADTVATHGSEWAYNYYVRKHGMEYWEFRFWLTVTGNITALEYYQ